MIKICPICKKEFTASPSGKKYCSNECKQKALVVWHEHTCLYCGRVFKNKKKHSKYCSVECNSKAQQKVKDINGTKQRVKFAWRNMKNRCYNVNNIAYENYGGRGIKVCDEWKDDFSVFYDWALSNGYKNDLTIDRIDVNGDYEPYNCRWVDYTVQNKNRRFPKPSVKCSSEMLDKTCQYCGKHYRSSSPDSKYCSRECLYASRRVDKTCICPVCGKQFLRKKSNQRYCSLSCSNEAQKSIEDVYGNAKRLKRIWINMRNRCRNTEYKNYGGRGISVCKEWDNSFKAFYEWANNNDYNDSLSIDRINVDGNYCPENCRWVNAKQQANNKRNNRFITYSGTTMTIGAWAKKLGLTWDILNWRLEQGWGIERVLFAPRMKNSFKTVDGRDVKDIDIKQEILKYNLLGEFINE